MHALLNYIRRIDPSFIVAFFISLLLWISLSLSEERSIIVTIPLSVEPPEGFSVLDQLPEEFSFVYRGSGYQYIRFNKEDQLQLTFNKPNDILISSSYIEAALERQFGVSTEQIARIDFPEFMLRFDSLSVKSFKLEEKFLHYTIDRGLIQQGKPQFSIDSFSLYGPKKLMDEINDWNPIDTVLGVLNQSASHLITLRAPYSTSYEIIPAVIKVDISLEKAIEKNIVVPIKIDNTIDEQVTIIPNSITIKFIVGLSNFDKVSANDFTFVAEVKDPKELKVPVMMIKAPVFIERPSQSLDSVSFFIIK